MNALFTCQEFAEVSAQHRVEAQRIPDSHLVVQCTIMSLQRPTFFLKLTILEVYLEMRKQNLFSYSTLLFYQVSCIYKLIHTRKNLSSVIIKRHGVDFPFL